MKRGNNNITFMGITFQNGGLDKTLRSISFLPILLVLSNDTRSYTPIGYLYDTLYHYLQLAILSRNTE